MCIVFAVFHRTAFNALSLLLTGHPLKFNALSLLFFSRHPVKFNALPLLLISKHVALHQQQQDGLLGLGKGGGGGGAFAVFTGDP